MPGMRALVRAKWCRTAPIENALRTEERSVELALAMSTAPAQLKSVVPEGVKGVRSSGAPSPAHPSSIDLVPVSTGKVTKLGGVVHTPAPVAGSPLTAPPEPAASPVMGAPNFLYWKVVGLITL